MQKINKWKSWLLKICIVIFLFSLLGCQAIDLSTPPETPNTNTVVSVQETPVKPGEKEQPSGEEEAAKVKIEKGKSYSTKEEVAEYIHEFKTLPPNYITKAEARKLGWDNTKGNLWEVTDKRSIGGDVFGNYEGLLPQAKGRVYYECDVNYNGGFRGAERLVYSNDGLIFYTADHYKTFERLY